MSWEETLQLEVVATFRSLSGGDHYDRLVEAMWLGQQLQKERDRERHIERWSSAVHRRHFMATRREWRARARKTTVAVRWCRICAKPYELTLFARAEGKANACSPACRRLATGKWPLFRIGREQDTLTGWAKRHRMDVETVRWRVKRGWPLDQALRTPPAPPGKRGGGTKRASREAA